MEKGRITFHFLEKGGRRRREERESISYLSPAMDPEHERGKGAACSKITGQ